MILKLGQNPEPGAPTRVGTDRKYGEISRTWSAPAGRPQAVSVTVSGQLETRRTAQASVSIRMESRPLAGTVACCCGVRGAVLVSNSMPGWFPTTPQDYPEWSGFGRQRERECGSTAAPAAGSIRRTHPCASTSSAMTESRCAASRRP